MSISPTLTDPAPDLPIDESLGDINDKFGLVRTHTLGNPCRRGQHRNHIVDAQRNRQTPYTLSSQRSSIHRR